MEKHCKACEGNESALTSDESTPLLVEVPTWHMVEDKQLEKMITFKNFQEALIFINKIGEIAETENHHPDICLTEYKKVKITLSTHAIKGLSENDFILASKIDAVLEIK